MLALLLAACAGEVGETPASAERLGVGTSPGFSDWITEPSIVNGEVVETLPDVDTCPGCPATTRQAGVVSGGTYGFDSDGDRAFDQILTLDAVVLAEAELLPDGTYRYEWTFANHGSGSLVAIGCGPNAPTFGIALDEPLLGTAGADRVIGTGDDLAEGQVRSATVLSPLPPRPVLCAITTNPTTARSLELLVPLPASPNARGQCVDGGWLDFDFRNQGQCVRFVETGEDSREAAVE